jgi:hypothetical protein
MRIRVLGLAFVTVLACVGVAHAKSAVQINPDGDFILVNKTVGNEQWVLALDTDLDRLFGNVFNTSGGAATFFSCDVNWSDGGVSGDVSDLSGQTATFDCSVASGCSTLPCDPDVEWHAVGGAAITLPGSFFLP